MATFVLTETPKTAFSWVSSGSILTMPNLSQGQEGRNLLQWVGDIFSRWQEQPPLGLNPPPKLLIEPNPAQVAANQAAIALLRSWWDEGDEQEQRETLAYLQQVLDEDRFSDRPLFR